MIDEQLRIRLLPKRPANCLLGPRARSRSWYSLAYPDPVQLLPPAWASSSALLPGQAPSPSAVRAVPTRGREPTPHAVPGLVLIGHDVLSPFFPQILPWAQARLLPVSPPPGPAPAGTRWMMRPRNAAPAPRAGGPAQFFLAPPPRGSNRGLSVCSTNGDGLAPSSECRVLFSALLPALETPRPALRPAFFSGPRVSAS